jgi:hypothetical protein
LFSFLLLKSEYNIKNNGKRYITSQRNKNKRKFCLENYFKDCKAQMLDSGAGKQDSLVVGEKLPDDYNVNPVIKLLAQINGPSKKEKASERS